MTTSTLTGTSIRPSKDAPGQKTKKTNPKPPAKSTPKVHRVGQPGQKRVRKSEPRPLIYNELDRVKLNISQMVASRIEKKNIDKYAAIARELSAIAKLNNGHVWSWRYVMSVEKGTMQPGKKFIQAVMLCSQKNNFCKQWFYFTYRRSVAAIYNKSIMAEIIRINMRKMGYKQVVFSRYMEIKRMATKKHVGKPA